MSKLNLSFECRLKDSISTNFINFDEIFEKLSKIEFEYDWQCVHRAKNDLNKYTRQMQKKYTKRKTSNQRESRWTKLYIERVNWNLHRFDVRAHWWIHRKIVIENWKFNESRTDFTFRFNRNLISFHLRDQTCDRKWKDIECIKTCEYWSARDCSFVYVNFKVLREAHICSSLCLFVQNININSFFSKFVIALQKDIRKYVSNFTLNLNVWEWIRIFFTISIWIKVIQKSSIHFFLSISLISSQFTSLLFIFWRLLSTTFSIKSSLHSQFLSIFEFLSCEK